MNASIPPLTGLRFIAAMMVFVSHYPIPGAPPWLQQITASGYAGVTLFFVLSGFILAYNYSDAFMAQPGRHVGAYFLSRFARIYPLYIVTILYAWAAGSGGPLWPFLLAVQAWSPDLRLAYGLNPPSWSIGVEVFLYACFPIMVLAGHRLGILRSRNRTMMAAGVVVALMLALATAFVLAGASELGHRDPASAHRWLYRTPAFRLLDFALGILAASFVHGMVLDAAQQRRWEWAGYGAIAGAMALMAWPPHYYSAYSWDVSFAVPCAVVIVALTVAPGGVLAQLLASAALVSLGEASYAFYLVHVPAAPMLDLAAASLPRALMRYAAFLGVVICLSYGLHMIVERPARTYLRSFGYRVPLPLGKARR